MKHHVEDERLLDEFQTKTLKSIIAAQFFIIRNNLKNFFSAFTGFQETHKMLDCFLFVLFVSSFHYEVILIRKKNAQSGDGSSLVNISHRKVWLFKFEQFLMKALAGTFLVCFQENSLSLRFFLFFIGHASIFYKAWANFSLYYQKTDVLWAVLSFTSAEKMDKIKNHLKPKKTE